MSPVNARLGLQQRVLPEYRVPFFDLLAGSFTGGMSLFAGLPRPEESIAQGDLCVAQTWKANNLHLFDGKYYLCWQTGLLDWLDTWQPDVLILEANPRYLHSRAAVRWMHRRARPVLGWGLGAPPVRGVGAAARSRLRRSFLAQFDAMITYSAKGAAEYRACGFPEDRIFVAPNAVAPKPLQPAPARPDSFNVGKAVVLFVGRLQARKRLDLLFKACALLPEHLQPQVWVVGDGPARDEIELLAKEIYPAAAFFGALHGEALAPYFEGADLFVLPGTGGLAVQQAMSFGLPVLVAEADGTQVDLVRPENGWCVEPGNLSDLMKMLEEALSDAGRLRRMGERSYQIVSQQINLEKMVEVFEEAVRSVWRDN